MDDSAAGLSASAKKRARAKAAKELNEAAAPTPEPTLPPAKDKSSAKSKAAPKAAAGAPAAKASPKVAPAAEPKAKAKGKAKAEAPPAAEPAPAGTPVAKPAAKKKKNKAKEESGEAPQEQPKKKESEVLADGAFLDDGTGGEWEVAADPSKVKQEQRKQKKLEEQKKAEEEAKAKADAAAKALKDAQAAAQAAAKAAAQAKGKAAEGAKPTAADALKAAEAAKGTVTAADASKAASAPEKPQEAAEVFSASIAIPEGKIGRIIGPKGANLALVKEKTGVSRIDTDSSELTVSGPTQESVTLAELALRELVEKGYMSLGFEDFKEDVVKCHPSVFPDLIGKGGCIIRKIKEALEVEINIPQVPKNSPEDKKFDVALAGSGPNVEKAKVTVQNIAMYGHDEVTHPGQAHEELEVPDWQYKFIIGAKGSEMRHISNSFHVKLNIPREHSECQNVLIIGEAADVEKAATYVKKSLEAAAEPKGRDKESAPTEDKWDRKVDEDHEPWMDQYMYKRK